MKTYKKLYKKLYSTGNLNLAFRKARRGKSKKDYVISFEEDLEKSIALLQRDLRLKRYTPTMLKKFIIRDPKTRTIHASTFRDRIVHHAVVNILQPVYEKRFIYDSFAGRKNKGTHKAVKRFEYFLRKVSSNGRKISRPFNNNSIRGFILKADIKHYFDEVNHNTLINILRKKINDEKLISLISKVLKNHSDIVGMPLGNMTSQ
ncbi:hypothetical protein LCGC14_1332820, partial [marine sediment metagenome]